MELDALKEIWQNADAENKNAPLNSEIMEMLNQSPKSPVAKMMRNVFIETVLINVLFGGVAIFYFFAFKGRFSSIAWLYIITAALSTIYYIRKWRLLYKMQCVACQVKSNLQGHIKVLEKYVRLYAFAGTAIVPFLFIFLGILFYYHFPSGRFFPLFPPFYSNSIVLWISWLFVQSLFTYLVYRVNVWYIDKLYGKHIYRLKQLIAQLEEE